MLAVLINNRALFPAMIQNWRSSWGQGAFPFFFVTACQFQAGKGKSREKVPGAELREAQLMGHFHCRIRGMAVTIDIGEADDIHPRNKQDVGLRLALSAESYCVYGMDATAFWSHLSVYGD